MNDAGRQQFQLREVLFQTTTVATKPSDVAASAPADGSAFFHAVLLPLVTLAALLKKNERGAMFSDLPPR